MKPFDYQQDYLTAVEAGWGEYRKQLIVAPTGSGKTCMFVWIAERFVKQGKRVLILVDQDELAKQTLSKLLDVAGIIGGHEQAELRADRASMVVVATVQSMARRLDQWAPDWFGLVIADEADKSISPQWQRVLNRFDRAALVCGFTATPHRTDKRNLGVYYGNLIELESLTTLIRKGYLAPVRVEMVPIRIDLTGASRRGGDYNDEELDRIITPHLEEIARVVAKHGVWRRSLVFLPLIKTCEKFNEIARSLGLSSDFIYGQDPERDSKLARFRNWDFDVLANSMLLTRGVDIPAVDLIMPARPTKSITLYFQMVGRGTRMAPGKTECILLDPLYQASKRLICRPAHLIAKDDEEVEQITAALEAGPALPGDVAAQLDLVTVAAEVSSQREDALRKRLDACKDKKAKTISAEEFAMQHGSLATAEYAEVMPWESQPITHKQTKWLNRAKIDLGSVRSKGHASKLLSLYFDKKPLELASPGQRALMGRMGHPNAEHATADEARKFFVGLKKAKEQAVMAL